MALKNESLSATSKNNGDKITTSIYSDLSKLLANDIGLDVDLSNVATKQTVVVSCMNSCALGCSNGCSGTCGNTCGGKCLGSCTGGCGGGCSGSCTGDCDNGCRGGCDYGCAGAP